MKNYQKAKKLIKEAKNIAIFPCQDLKIDSFCASLALFYSLKELKEKVNLIIEKIPEKFQFLIEKESSSISFDSLISIKEETKISQVFYEKTDNRLNLYFKTKNGVLKKDNISFKQIADNSPSELLITLGVKQNKDIPQITPVINIDNQINNENFGEINLIKNCSLPEIVFELLETLLEKIFTSLTAFQLFNKVLDKINFNKEKNIVSVILKEEDFFETNSKPADLPYSLKQLKTNLALGNFLILYPNHHSTPSTKGVFYSEDENKLLKILENLKGVQARKGKGILFEIKENNLEKIKNEIINFV
ncbi:hypothetical protein COS93_02630 [bacterium (Candidatus Gribaldobacteria) CG07_land_8_20_14_0_80_33_18]|uniref:Uncharacterized protein n=1 Tax=bacterium (Candidatus Gribaldobacteria) CG07_land_8_20_14_0_80_33_18 TaxID=2014272 RepID=A0A2M6Z252_9BACT|nr:MAG: hypothetical protein COU04_00605 [bacterium (Candidatus Gribaldobacteria) CG10_big_fil_rev_8_21_14_0_10_33_41]PIU46397.1 MAG: hypothetical protein COS93_02630 [bacterium (Candidatus Gribaldobacteria) CG07_land_8_20_14_0_80_33_18]PJA01016.1 MAG: hypothetical protein COX75_01040 [bacterium (Candidatus Gribaldobacteria) CG_4_10_14_0_2_um_filter_33_15]PJB08538.1 MAG: hypothetical protein CO122_01570 [bacterium (Candidatus Gribaldobacteria) CG_4_9_14_3_um_filter_33_9]